MSVFEDDDVTNNPLRGSSAADPWGRSGHRGRDPSVRMIRGPAALGMACCQHNYRVRFVTAAELVTLLVEAQQQGRLARKLDQLARL